MQPTEISLSPAYIEAIMTCVSSTHILLNIFLDMHPNTIRALPIFQLVRMIYGVVILIKLSLSASTPASEIGKVLDYESVQVTQYMDKLLVHLMRALGPKKHRGASKFLAILMTLKSWYFEQTLKGNVRNEDKVEIEPRTHRGRLAEPLHEILRPYQLGSSYQESQEQMRDPATAKSAELNQPLFRMATMGASQQESQLPSSHCVVSSNGGNRYQSPASGMCNPQDFQSSQIMDQANPSTFSYSVDSTNIPTYDDSFDVMDTGPNLVPQYGDMNFSAEELDAWIVSQGMPGLISTDGMGLT